MNFVATTTQLRFHRHIHIVDVQRIAGNMILKGLQFQLLVVGNHRIVYDFVVMYVGTKYLRKFLNFEMNPSRKTEQHYPS